MICFAEDAPETDAMRCVPQAWCVPSPVTPTQIWNDTGAGGGKPGSLWTINSLNMLAVVVGHEAPKEIFYELKNRRFMVNELATVDGDGEVYFN